MIHVNGFQMLFELKLKCAKWISFQTNNLPFKNAIFALISQYIDFIFVL